jgi:N-acetylmuramoyl-L-alanine amidase
MTPDNNEEALALTMVGEARGEDREGMQAVGNTVMNRLALNTWFGHTIKEICLKPWQYSCWNAGDPNSQYLADLPESDPIYQTAYGIAVGLVAGTIVDITNGATHYFRIGTPIPAWATGKASCAHIGNHLFFKDIA